MGYKLNKKQGTGNSPKVTIRLTEQQHKCLDKIAKIRKEKRSDLMRMILITWLSREIKNYLPARDIKKFHSESA